MENRLKAKLAAGRPAFGVSVMIPSPQAVEMLGAAGFDWVLLDCEHGALSLESVELMAMAAEASGMTAIARPASRAPEHILQVLDRGVLGVQVPHVSSAAAAREAVAAAKYHPRGRRSLAAGTRAARYDAHGGLKDYVRAANDATLVAVQIEEPSAVQDIGSILQVDGVDVFFIGPSDLSQAMGYPGEPKAPPVAAAIGQCLAAITAAGRTPGMPATADNVDELLGKGVRYLYTHLPRLLARAGREFRR